MGELEKHSGGHVAKLWNKHGGGYYAAASVGTFLYLEFIDIVETAARSTGVGDFLRTELLTFLIDTVVNTALASFWPVAWFLAWGVVAFAWAGGGYLVWTLALAIVLDRREKRIRKDLGI